MNYELIILALIAGLPATITAIAALVLQISNSKKLDGKLSQLVESKVEAATATATLVEKEAESVRQETPRKKSVKQSED